MKPSPFLYINEKPCPQTIKLLKSTYLGTKGAKYKLKNTDQRIKELDSPLYLSLKRKNSILGNITFCRRNSIWYIRYFAFHSSFQSGEKRKHSNNKKGIIKTNLEEFFESVLNNKFKGEKCNGFYAYIDPLNERSSWFSKVFRFQKIDSLATQTFSRLFPKKSNRFIVSNYNETIGQKLQQQYSNHLFFFQDLLKKSLFYCLRNDENEIIAIARCTKAEWEIERLPGRFGKTLTKIIPFIPVLNLFIKPKQHRFLVTDSVYIKNNEKEILEELFSSLLAHFNERIIFWWVSQQDTLYNQVKNKIRWGIMHRFLSVPAVDVVFKGKKEIISEKPVFTFGQDFV